MGSDPFFLAHGLSREAHERTAAKFYVRRPELNDFSSSFERRVRGRISPLVGVRHDATSMGGSPWQSRSQRYPPTTPSCSSCRRAEETARPAAADVLSISHRDRRRPSPPIIVPKGSGKAEWLPR